MCFIPVNSTFDLLLLHILLLLHPPIPTMSAQPPKPAPIVLSPEAQATFDLITRDLDEVLLPEIIKEKLANGEVVKCYWGTAPTGRRT